MVPVETLVFFCERESHVFCFVRARTAESADQLFEHSRMARRVRHATHDGRKIGDRRGERQKAQPIAQLIRVALCQYPSLLLGRLKGLRYAVGHKLDVDVLARENQRQQQACARLPRRERNEFLYRQVTLAMRERSEEHTSELQSLMRISYAVFGLNKQTKCRLDSARS